jgi:hypothetical protein
MGRMELLREWLRGVVLGVAQDPEHLLVFVGYVVLIAILILGATSTVFGWPYDLSGLCGYGDAPDVGCP